MSRALLRDYIASSRPIEWPCFRPCFNHCILLREELGGLLQLIVVNSWLECLGLFKLFQTSYILKVYLGYPVSCFQTNIWVNFVNGFCFWFFFLLFINFFTFSHHWYYFLFHKDCCGWANFSWRYIWFFSTICLLIWRRKIVMYASISKDWASHFEFKSFLTIK